MSDAVFDRLTEGLRNCTPAVRSLLEELAALTGEPVTGGLVAAAQLCDDATALARAMTVLQAELARRTHAATVGDVLPTSATTVLSGAGVPYGVALATRRAGAFTARWPQLGRLMATGQVNTDVAALIAAMTAQLPDQQTGQILDTLLPTLPQLTRHQVKQAVTLAIDLLRPQDAASKEQSDWEARSLTRSHCNGMWEFALTLPELEGAAFWATLNAIADGLRASDTETGTRATAAQRRADAVAAVVAKAHAAGVTPTSKGSPAAAVMTIGLTEAERVAAGQPRQPASNLAAAAAAGAPAAHLLGSDTTLGDAAARFIMCNAHSLTGLLVQAHGATDARDTTLDRPSPLATALGLAVLLPLAEGRTKRCFTEAQRRAMAARDQGCVIPSCPVPPGECEAHHVTDWAAGGATDIDNGALVCWTHHREVDLGRRRIHRNPDPTGRYWTVTDIPRHQWPPNPRRR